MAKVKIANSQLEKNNVRKETEKTLLDFSKNQLSNINEKI